MAVRHVQTFKVVVEKLERKDSLGAIPVGTKERVVRRVGVKVVSTKGTTITRVDLL